MKIILKIKIVALVFAGAFVLQSMAAANATNLAPNYVDGSTGCSSKVSRADGGDYHSFAYESLSTEMTSAVTWARTNAVSGAGVATTLQASANSATDVRATDTNYHTLCGYEWYQPYGSNGVYLGDIVGLYTCESYNSSGRCGSAIVRYNNYFTAQQNAWTDQSLATHEIGHSLGLKHLASNGGTTLGAMTANGFLSRYYSSHDIAHLTSLY